MEPRVIYNQYSVGAFGHYLDVDRGDLVEGHIKHVIHWQGSSAAGDSVFLILKVSRGIRTIRVVAGGGDKI